MGITHFSGLSVSGTMGFTGPVAFNGTVTVTGSKTHTLKGKYNFPGKLAVSGSAGFTGPISFTGTVLVTGSKTHTLKGTFNLAGKLAATGSVTITGGGNKGARLRLRSGGTGALCGITAIGASGSVVISTNKISSTSVVILTPMVNTGLKGNAFENYAARATGVSFKTHLVLPLGTAMTGRIGWAIIN